MGDIIIPGGADEESLKIGGEAESASEKKEEKKPEEPKKVEEPKKAEEPEKPKKEEAGEKGKTEEGKPEEQPEGGDKKEDKPKRTPKLMEVYKHKIAEEKWGKEKEALSTKVTDLEKQIGKKPHPDRKEDIAKFAEEHGLEPKMVSGLLGLVEDGRVSELEKKLDSLKGEIETGRVTREQAHQEGEFGKDYTKAIIPILDNEKVPSDKKKEIKEIIHTLAFTAEFASYDLEDIYFKAKRRGDFDEIVSKGKKSAEPGKNTHGKAGEEETKPFKDMSDAEFDKASEEGAKGEKKFNIKKRGEIDRSTS